MPPLPRLGLLVALLAVTGCGDTARLTVAEGTGPTPTIPEPNPTLIPTVNFADAEPWPDGWRPTTAPGLTATVFASGLDHPRWLHVLPNGDVLVAESNAPASSAPSGIRGFIQRIVMKRAGAITVSADRITLLRDTDGDGDGEVRFTLLEDLASPFGMALVGDRLIVANSGSLVSFPFEVGQTRISATPDTLARFPTGPVNRHWTRSLLLDPDGRTLYVGVGSASNVAEEGIAMEEGRAAVWAVDAITGETRILASGLRNPVGLAIEPTTGALWTAVNERDELGSDLVPDYMTRVQDGGFYGWPYSYFGDTVDTRVEPQRPDLVAQAIVPDYALGPHTASLGLAWVDPGLLGAEGGMAIGQHGSWNRRPPSGYRVVFVPFADGMPSGQPVDVLSGFLSEDEEDAYGRPVGVEVASDGALLVADDVGNVIWRVARSD